VLFADLKGSTELIAGLDPEEARTLLDPALHAMMAAVHRYEGTVNQVLGDGIMALFGRRRSGSSRWPRSSAPRCLSPYYKPSPSCPGRCPQSCGSIWSRGGASRERLHLSGGSGTSRRRRSSRP
jgi:hypothetical protein